MGFVSAAGVYRRRENLDAVEARGVEFDARMVRGAFSLSASYAFADARVTASGTAAALDGLRPAQTALHQASATLGWAHGGRALALTGRYAGPQYEDDQNARMLADALTLDAVARLPLAAGIALEARAENLADARVEAGISGDDLIERATPRTLWIGVRYALR